MGREHAVMMVEGCNMHGMHMCCSTRVIQGRARHACTLRDLRAHAHIQASMHVCIAGLMGGVCYMDIFAKHQWHCPPGSSRVNLICVHFMHRHLLCV
jgi:hypothetical protein